jgi:serine/threonine protein kinase
VVPTITPHRAEAGLVVGGYELVRRIGRGGMAEVWVARRALGSKGTKFVAIKLMADHYVGHERYGRMFRAEAELAAVLSHANIVQVFDEGEDEGRSFLVMEWVDGVNLLKLGAVLALLDDEPRRLRVIAYIIGQLLHALHYAHSITSADGNPLGVVHRDVSPQNVLVSNHGEVKLTDFGVAHHALEESSGVHVKGKVRYMSPEQLSGCTRSPTVDLYAVGALLHELLDGRKFRGEHEDGQELFAAVLSGRVAPLGRPAPPELDLLRLRLLEPDPKRRLQTAAQAFALLKRYPGYGDARDELTKLCASLTGVMRPRAGLGCPTQHEPDTLRWSGGRSLARPKLHLDPRRPPSQPISRAPMAASHAGSPTTAKVADAAVCGVPLVGCTDVAPPPREQITNEATPKPWRGSGTPTWPEGDPGPRPQPTERLVRATAAMVADVVEPGLLIEAASPSETDPSIPIVSGSSEDTDTRPGIEIEPRRRPRHRAGESRVMRWGRAALAGPGSSREGLAWRSAVRLGLGMGLVAVISASTAWWLISGSVVTEATTSLESRDTPAEPLAMAIGLEATRPPPHDRTSPPPRQPAIETEPSPAAPTNPTDRVLPVAPAPAPRKTKVPRALMKVQGGMGLKRAQVRVASRTVTVGEHRGVLVPAGEKSLQWRAHARDTWKPGGSWRFRPGTTVMAFVSKDGLKLRTLP